MDKNIRIIVENGHEKMRRRVALTEEESYLMNQTFLDLAGQKSAEEYAKAIHDKILIK